MIKRVFVSCICFLSLPLFAQSDDSTRWENDYIDSLYIAEVEDRTEPDKVLHAEPLFIDLIRDLGARKGEKEWNLGLGLTDNLKYDAYTALIEYEFAPVNRLGVEFELPFTLYSRNSLNTDSIPQNKLNSIKSALQYSFFVSEKWKTSMAIGYIHELELKSFDLWKQERAFDAHVFNPFFIAAKRFGDRFHSLIYVGPKWTTHKHTSHTKAAFQWNSNLHYMIPGTRNFVGLEMNKEWTKNDFDLTLRPQMRVGISDRTLIGIVTGIPVNRENQRLSAFLRLIYEPGHRH